MKHTHKANELKAKEQPPFERIYVPVYMYLDIYPLREYRLQYNNFIISNHSCVKEKKCYIHATFNIIFFSLLGLFSSWGIKSNFSIDLLIDCLSNFPNSCYYLNMHKNQNKFSFWMKCKCINFCSIHYFCF